MTRRRTRAAALATTAALGLSLALGGCALFADSPEEAYGRGSTDGPLHGVDITVGSKNFTEQLVLCEVLAQRLEAMSAHVTRTCGMAGSSTVRQALTKGSIDAYWEYTGTAWVTYLQQTAVIKDPDAQFAAVRDKDAANGISWLGPARANDTFAFLVARSTARSRHVTTLSDFAKAAREDPAGTTFCGVAEFLGRDDGWAGVQHAYGFTLPRSSVKTLADGAQYQAVQHQNPCVYAVGLATDGRVKALDLQVLEDDKAFFPFYNIALTVRSSVLKEHPAVGAVMDPVIAMLTNDVMQDLNRRVDVAGEAPEDVARDWLHTHGLA